MKIIFLNSHPIQYFAPLYKYLEEKGMNVLVYYCSDNNLKKSMDKEFRQEIQWDIPLLDGYSFKFLKNFALKSSVQSSFWKLINVGILKELWILPKSLVVVHGWAYFTNVLTLIFGKFFGHTICLRAETPLNQEIEKEQTSKWIQFFKKIYLKFLFLFVDYFLYIGTQNKKFYLSYNIKSDKLIFTPYSVDNNRFNEFFKKVDKISARKKLELPENKKIILFSGKYIDKKNPLTIMEAFHKANRDDTCLVMVGEGSLRNEMETYIKINNLKEKIILTGFINQSKIPFYYAASDIFVMASGIGETWGLSINEAMNFGLPLIVSETTGSSYDLVKEGVNGYIFKTNDINQLTNCFNKMFSLTEKELQDMQKSSLSIIQNYNYDNIFRSLKEIA